eukprot:TRINITY_DN45809_c1_g1_i2.p2 TRINITY_DN45809_c1_g1~~TRINITY_DN45809_c1_g1_i2.p2  ORF type:complete len:107 (-),score=8.44 TRINITY_DN45809_c1_g1_i2:49-369(-)
MPGRQGSMEFARSTRVSGLKRTVQFIGPDGRPYTHGRALAPSPQGPWGDLGNAPAPALKELTSSYVAPKYALFSRHSMKALETHHRSAKTFQHFKKVVRPMPVRDF